MRRRLKAAGLHGLRGREGGAGRAGGRGEPLQHGGRPQRGQPGAVRQGAEPALQAAGGVSRADERCREQRLQLAVSPGGQEQRLRRRGGGRRSGRRLGREYHAAGIRARQDGGGACGRREVRGHGFFSFTWGLGDRRRRGFCENYTAFVLLQGKVRRGGSG
ncbi:hypothetical protein [Paenibacillus mucilaginosus]|uniref:hypothetical protein n=1 Tax=Paenibacillus mucilaginosus TaxID=61624 RepID=UPI002378013D|nr:hypothetical protein [Paenibacillus mucilaginosus]WDM28031.1 hypothetical protein KCX80_01750 [Paenibacillus mucilaginosus]